MAKKVSGTKKVDTITVNASNVIVVTGKKMKRLPLPKAGKIIFSATKEMTLFLSKAARKTTFTAMIKSIKSPGRIR